MPSWSETSSAMALASRSARSPPAKSPDPKRVTPRLLSACPRRRARPPAGDLDRALARRPRLLARSAQHEDLGLGCQHAGERGRRRVGREHADGVAVRSQAPVAVARDPQIAPDALAREGRADDVAAAVGELDGHAPERDRAVVLARDVGVVRRVGDHVEQIELRALGGVLDEVPDLERALEVLAGFHEGEDLLGLQAGAHVRGQRLGHPVRRAPVQRELSRRGAVGQAGVVAQGLGQREVQRRALPGQQVGVGRLLEQRVAEGVAARIRRTRTCWATASRSASTSAGLGRAHNGREQAVARAPSAAAATRSTPRASSGSASRRRLRTSRGVRRQRPGNGVGRRQQLFGEEGRCPRSACAGGATRSGGRGVAEDARHLLGELGLREKSPDLEALDDGPSFLLGQERAQRVAAVRLVAAVGADEEQGRSSRMPRTSEERNSSVERSAQWMSSSGEDDRRLLGQAVEQRPQESEEARLPDGLAGGAHALAGLVRRAGRAQLGQQPSQVAGPMSRPAPRSRRARARAPAPAARPRSARRAGRRRRRPGSRPAARARRAPARDARARAAAASCRRPTRRPRTPRPRCHPRPARALPPSAPARPRARRTRDSRHVLAHWHYLRPPPARRGGLHESQPVRSGGRFDA